MNRQKTTDIELKEQLEFFQYENKQMGDFLESLGLTPNEITSYVINGDIQFKTAMVAAIKNYLLKDKQ